MDINELLNNLRTYTQTIYDILHDIESTDEFKNNIDPDLKQYFYHSYIKCKRNFKAINILISCRELQNGYIEAIPLLRVMVESYLHFCYIIHPDFKDEAIMNYDRLKKYQIKQMINNRIGYKVKLTGMADKKLLERIRKEVNGIKFSDLGPFKDIYELAKKTDNELVYNNIYRKFNSFVHFNPTTYISYGSETGKRGFNFGRYEPQPERECEILYYSIDIIIRLIVQILTYIDIKEAPQELHEGISKWISLREEYKNTMSSHAM
ncbi:MULTISPECIES: DUF5677 domain-containing protein [Parageobacillus]|uniref:Uncharacterized protein n=1 Tax=Parageobacillus thermoglucosidasius TaxID=1426 RepID=A0A1B7KSP4_PARTM|nr:MULTISPECIES: DUF5677 domain-containing protein [Parageobacillus]OAT73096.1 hypothetical protein A7K69_18665 [Parageobacillus thermoglucosidasius]BDG46026.1 hypothetical protein PspKH34_05870 [Parageobacillus sp. KH3-4]